MLAVDLIVGALILAAAVWGFRTGVAGTLGFAGFAIGALAGATLAPLLLRGGQDNDYALVLALPAALVLGGLLAATVERRFPPPRRRRPRRGQRRKLGSAIGGAVVAGLAGLTFAWLV